MTKLNMKFIIAVAAIVFASVVIGIGILAINKINNLSNEIESLSNRITQIDYNDGATQNQINNLKNEIRQMLEEQSRNYCDVSYKIIDINVQNKTAVVEIYFSLKESPLSGDVEVSFGKGNEFSQIAATKLTNGKYMAELELQIYKNYEISYSVALSTVKTEKLPEIHVFEQLMSRFNINVNYESVNRGDWKLSFYLNNGYLSNDNLKIASAKLEIFRDNVLIKTINVKDHNPQSTDGYESYWVKGLAIDGFTPDVFANSDVETRITVIDGYGLEYIF